MMTGHEDVLRMTASLKVRWYFAGRKGFGHADSGDIDEGEVGHAEAGADTAEVGENNLKSIDDVRH